MRAKAWGWGIVAACAMGMRAQSATAVAQLDLTRFSTTWYEVARYPVKAEKKCVRDGLFLFASGDKPGRLEEVQSCVLASGFANVRNIHLRLKNKNISDGRLQTSFLFFFHRKQWVLALGPDYDWALLGTPNHKQLWLLSKTFEMTPEVLAEARQKAASEGFDPGKLLLVPQTKEGRVR